MTSDRKEQVQQKFGGRMGNLSIFLISQVGHLVAKRANRELVRSGFTLQIEQIPILFTIYFAGDGLLSQQEIANMLQKDKSGIQRSIRTLERDGYLRISSDDVDRRKNLIQLTPAGKLVIDKAIETAEHIDKQITDQLNADEVRSLLTTLRKISTLLE